MPRLSNGMGVGAQSAEKFHDFEGIVDIVAKRAMGALERCPTWRRPYVWADLTSGSGYDDLPEGSTVKGTPLTAMDRLHERYAKKGIPSAAVFFEREPDRAVELRAALLHEYGPSSKDVSYKVHARDSHEFLEAFCDPKAIPGEMGAFVYDPTEAVDLDFMADIANAPHLKRYDLLVYVSATSIKRPRSLPAHYQTDRRTLVERLTAINKRKIIVRKPSGPSEWSWFIMTNDRHFPVWHKAAGRSNNLDFFDIVTPEGRAVLEHLNWTRAERLHQTYGGGLFK
jgi:hypothetical protein